MGLSKIQELILFLQGMILAGTVGRIIYCLLAMSADSDEEKTYRVRIRNAAVFCILAEVITSLIRVVQHYF